MIDEMRLGDVKKRLQDHFTDGLVTIVGSGLSVAEGIPGMVAVAKHILASVPGMLSDASRPAWDAIKTDLTAGVDLESTLLKTPPDLALEALILQRTGGFIREAETTVIEEVVLGKRTLRFSKLLKHMLKPNTGIPVVTTNYDRLIEVAAEVVDLGVDTLFVGQHIGKFDQRESRYSLCRGIIQRRKSVHLSYADHIVLLKPHGSLDWFLNSNEPIRSPMVSNCQPLIITPGINKFRGGYERPFDAHRERANKEIDRGSRYLIIGYGFNDDHLQVHLEHQLRSGKPALHLSRSLSSKAKKLLSECDGMWAVCLDKDSGGSRIVNRDCEIVVPGHDLWDLGVFIDEVLEP